MPESDGVILARLNELAHEMARLKSRFGTELPGGRFSVVRARLGEERVDFHLDFIARTVGMATLQPISDSSPPLLGTLRLGSNLVPVLCLRRLFGFVPSAYSCASAIVLLRHGEYLRGVVVDEVEGLFEVSSSDLLLPDSAHPHRRFLWGLLDSSSETDPFDRPVWLLNPLVLLGEGPGTVGT